jgi:membrane fusion protein (multidrug efflux system)
MSVAALMLLSLVGLSSCGDSKSEGVETSGNQQTDVRMDVDVREVAPEPFSEILHLTGYIKSIDDVVISTEEGGVLHEWLRHKGTHVEKGEVIARMNDDVLRPQYEAARAQYEIAELTYQKQVKVLEEQGISEVQVKTAQYTRDAAKAQMELAGNRLERTRIKSPISGILDDRLIDEGELAPPGSPVARIVNLDRMKVLVNVPENQAGAVSPGGDATISVSAFPGELFNGKVFYVGSAVVSDNRTIPVEILLRNPGRRMKPDMIARVTMKSTGHHNAILIEEPLVQQIDQRTTVVYVEEEGKVVRRPVTLGERSNGRVEIVGGLTEGDRVIVSGFLDVYDGQPVKATRVEGERRGDNENH